MVAPISIDDLEAGVRSGSTSALARAVSLVESSLPGHRLLAADLLERLGEPTEPAVRVGISGSPGVGKSTLVNALGLSLVGSGHRVAVIAVDPSSPSSGGSILGDRTRMGDLAAHPSAFVRASPSRGALGGVASATQQVVRLVEAAGHDVVLVETVGVGQSEVAVADLVDTFLLLMPGGGGDQVQGIKRGVLELADVIAVTKADGDGLAAARTSARDLAIATKLLSGHRRVPVLTCSALAQTGIEEVWQAVLGHRTTLVESMGLVNHRRRQQRRWMTSLMESTVLDALRGAPLVRDLAEAQGAAVERGEVDAQQAAERVVHAFAEQAVDLLAGDSSGNEPG